MTSGFTTVPFLHQKFNSFTKAQAHVQVI
ncbi:hypothetical protein CCP4SC76_3240002 [Gammaproteobacteria bacterium]